MSSSSSANSEDDMSSSSIDDSEDDRQVLFERTFDVMEYTRKYMDNILLTMDDFVYDAVQKVDGKASKVVDLPTPKTEKEIEESIAGADSNLKVGDYIRDFLYREKLEKLKQIDSASDKNFRGEITIKHGNYIMLYDFDEDETIDLLKLKRLVRVISGVTEGLQVLAGALAECSNIPAINTPAGHAIAKAAMGSSQVSEFDDSIKELVSKVKEWNEGLAKLLSQAESAQHAWSLLNDGDILV